MSKLSSLKKDLRKFASPEKARILQKFPEEKRQNYLKGEI
jgi:hypothetical protein